MDITRQSDTFHLRRDGTSKIQDLEKGVFTSDKALKGKHKGKFRKRAGNYRIVYLKENDILVITLIKIAHRKEVY